MTNHLPECDYERQDYRGNDNRICFCSRLRACEQRVRQTDWATDNAYWTGQTEGYAAALRDAVEAVKLSCSADIELVERTEVIAAIEAIEELKEKP